MTAPDPRPDEGIGDGWDDAVEGWPPGWWLLPLAVCGIAVWVALIISAVRIVGAQP